jgi:hypothetical protein
LVPEEYKLKASENKSLIKAGGSKEKSMLLYKEHH